jgi:hypothetical protein
LKGTPVPYFSSAIIATAVVSYLLGPTPVGTAAVNTWQQPLQRRRSISNSPFHDQVRETSLSWLSPSDLRSWHARLAQVLNAEGVSPPQRLLRHYKGAGNLPAAYLAALAAAEISGNALAFEQAAHFYAEALETGQADVAARATPSRLALSVGSGAGFAWGEESNNTNRFQ